MRTARVLWGLVLVAAIAVMPSVAAQETHVGDLFGDLVHIKRHPVTGQPILQKRMIEYPGDVLDWGYCPIPVDVYGFELPFLDLSCEVDPAAADRLVPVDYFGRLSAGRTRERNLRMHFDEVISNIKTATVVNVDASGRMVLGSECAPDLTCAVWKTIDSPLENMGLYHRLMKYGHLQTDPLEENIEAHGDPEAGTVYHPALGPEDIAKFQPGVATLLASPNPADCYSGETFIPACADQQSLTTADFIRAAVFLAGASDKHGRTTVDLIQFMNRILRIPVDTPQTPAALDTLPTLIRDEHGVVTPATPDLPAPADERFVDFTLASYLRADLYSGTFPALVPNGVGFWREEPAVSVLPFLRFINGAMTETATNMTGFLKAVSDAQRAIEFIHEYAIPEDIGAVGAATTTTVPAKIAQFSAIDQDVVLEAMVTDEAIVNTGTVTFTLMTSGGTIVGTPVMSAPVADGAAQVTYVLPANTPRQVLTILATFSGGAGFAPSFGLGTLNLVAVTTTTAITPASAPSSASDQIVPLQGIVTAANASPIDVGTMTFTVREGGGGVIGAPVMSAVVNNVANASYVLPGGVVDQVLTITGVFSGTADILGSSGVGTLTVGCPPVFVAPEFLPQAILGQAYYVALTADGIAPATASAVGTLPPGVVLSPVGVLSGVPTVAGAYSFSVTVSNAGGCTGARSYVLNVGLPLSFTTGRGPGSVSAVKAFLITGTPATTPTADYVAFDPAFQGGVRVALGDVTGDGVADTINGIGIGGGSRVTVVDGSTGVVVRDFMAFAFAPADGVYVASGDVDNDGMSDIIVGSGSGVGSIRVFSGRTGTLIRELTAFEGLLATGVRVGSADVNADGFADIIAGAGPGGTPTVQVFNGATSTIMGTFNAYTELFGGGVFVAGADVTGDGFGDIITGAGEGGGPHVRVWDGLTFEESLGFYGFSASFSGGVRVAGADLNRDGYAEIIVSQGPGGSPGVRVYDVKATALVADFLAADPSFTGGIFVAGAGPMVRMSVDIPQHDGVVTTDFFVAGWAFDDASIAGTGVDAVHVWAFPTGGGAPLFAGTALLGGDRPDVAAVFGDPWRFSGFNMITTLPPGVYDLVVFVHSNVSGTFNNRRVIRITVQ